MKLGVNIESWPPEPKAVSSNLAGRTIKRRKVGCRIRTQPFFAFCGKKYAQARLIALTLNHEYRVQ